MFTPPPGHRGYGRAVLIETTVRSGRRLVPAATSILRSGRAAGESTDDRSRVSDAELLGDLVSGPQRGSPAHHVGGEVLLLGVRSAGGLHRPRPAEHHPDRRADHYQHDDDDNVDDKQEQWQE